MAARTPTCHPERKHQAKGLCYPCYLRAWYAANPDKHRTYSRRHAERHPDARRVYYLANQERIKAYGLARYRADPSVRRRQVAGKHGLSLAEYDALLAGPCAICGAVATDIDHDHATGAVRGGLCGPCNIGLGNLQDDPEIVARAAEYLAARKPLLRLA